MILYILLVLSYHTIHKSKITTYEMENARNRDVAGGPSNQERHGKTTMERTKHD